MPQTPLTTATPYLTATQLFNYCDLRTLGDWLSDTGNRLGGTDPDPTLIAASPVLAELLMAASGELETVALVGGRYTPDDLAALTGAGAAKLREVVAGLVLRRIFRRRPMKAPPRLEVVEDAEQWMDALSQGARIFSTQEAADAGIPETPIDSPDDARARMLSSTIARRFFGRRMKDYPQG